MRADLRYAMLFDSVRPKSAMSPHDLGIDAGRSTESWTGDCPYGFDQLAERMEWLAGFGIGRKQCGPFPPLDPNRSIEHRIGDLKGYAEE